MRTPPTNVFMVFVEGEPGIFVHELEESAINQYDYLKMGGGQVSIYRATIQATEQLEVVRENAYLRPVRGAPS